MSDSSFTPIPILHEENAQEETKRQSRNMLSTISIAISINRWVVSMLNIACGVILIVVFAVSPHLPSEKRLLTGTIFGVVLFGLQAVMCVSRNDLSMLITYCILSSFASGLCLGLCLWYI